MFTNRPVDSEKKPPGDWKAVVNRISSIDDPDKSSASVLNQCENEGIKLTGYELSRVAKQLRRFRRYKLALEVQLQEKSILSILSGSFVALYLCVFQLM